MLRAPPEEGSATGCEAQRSCPRFLLEPSMHGERADARVCGRRPPLLPLLWARNSGNRAGVAAAGAPIRPARGRHWRAVVARQIGYKGESPPPAQDCS